MSVVDAWFVEVVVFEGLLVSVLFVEQCINDDGPTRVEHVEQFVEVDVE